MDREEAIFKAQRRAEANGWPFRPPIVAIRRRRLFRGALWHVSTNGGMIGNSVAIVIDERSGEIIKENFRPR